MPYQYLMMRSANGLAIHLAKSRAAEALCGVSITHLELRGLFDMSGCRKCARAAVKDGTTYLHDLDGERVKLEGFVPLWDR